MTTKDEVAQIIVNEARGRGHTRDEALAEMSALYQESQWDDTVWDPSHTTYGVAQQDASYPHRFEGAAAQIRAFMDRLDIKRTSPNHGDIWLNICWLQQAPNWPSAQYWWENGRREYLDEIKSRIGTVTPYLDRYWANEGGGVGFSGDPIWLEDVLREALGDRLVVLEGWQDRGTGGVMGDIWGVMIHHTGTTKERPEVIRDGVQQPGGFLPGPLSQGLITPDGKCHLVAVGPCNHAGIGDYGPLHDDGNRRLIGFECAWPTIRSDGSYDAHERWPDAQIITMRDTATAVVKRLGYDGSRVIGHKEYAGARQGKWDPGNLDMNWFREEVNKDLRGEFDGTPVPPRPDLPANHETVTNQIWDQVRILWPQLGYRTLVDGLGAIGEALGVEGMFDIRKTLQ